MRRTVAGLSLIAAAACGAVAALPSSAMAADRTVTLTLTCTNNTCNGGWSWYQGGTGGTRLSTGSMSGPVDATTTGTTVQPVAADTVIISVGSPPCGKSETDSFAPGSGINFTVRLNVKPSGSYGDGCRASFSMKS
jgi:hypothetical protein